MRLDGWDTLLFQHIKSRAKMPFAWGEHDCVMFAVGCAQAMTGVDLAESYRGYETQLQAARIIQDAGGFRELVTLNVGPEISPKLARRGDWVMISQGDSLALAVCIGSDAIAPGKDKLVSVPMSEAIAAWRID